MHALWKSTISEQCGHSRFDQDDCEIDLSALTSFQTGRSDCTPDSTLKRPFFTSREEIHPNLHGNGPSTVDFFKDHFGLTAREAAALVEGAHSFGKFHEEVSMHKYMWTRMNQQLLNNQQFRSLRNERMYKTECKNTIFYRIGKLINMIKEVINKKDILVKTNFPPSRWCWWWTSWNKMVSCFQRLLSRRRTIPVV